MNHKISCYRDWIKPQKHLFVKIKVILYLFDLLYTKSNIYLADHHNILMTQNQATYLSFPAAMSSTCDVMMIFGSTCAVVMRSRLQKNRFLESDQPSFRSRLNIQLLIFDSGCLPTNLGVTLKEPETDYMRDNSIAKFKVFYD